MLDRYENKRSGSRVWTVRLADRGCNVRIRGCDTAGQVADQLARRYGPGELDLEGPRRLLVWRGSGPAAPAPPAPLPDTGVDLGASVDATGKGAPKPPAVLEDKPNALDDLEADVDTKGDA